ncbi:MAG: PP2C family protein-serine/threonine phosphatase [Egibacteraceae bacterium]
MGSAVGSEDTSTGERALAGLLESSHYAAPEEMASLVAHHAGELGAQEAVMYLVGFEQRLLVPLPGDGVPQREAISVDHTLGGRAFRTIEVMRREVGDGLRLWVPMLNGTARVGVLELVLPCADTLTEGRARAFAGLVATLVITKGLYGDVFTLTRRTEPMSLAAEMQWELLPPLTFSDGRVTISGVLEPSHRVAGDTFDYALNDGCLHLLVIDAMGHGFEATLMATVVIGVYRHARRRGLTLPETYAAMDDAINRQFGLDQFVTGQLAELDTATGQLRWLNAGHPPPLLTRGQHVIGGLSCEPTLPIGFGGAVVEVVEYQLEPGDRLVFVTDGVLEARAPDGDFFGEARLGDQLLRATMADEPAPETVRRLTSAVMEHQDGPLRDDATVVLVEWSGRERTSPLTIGRSWPRPPA